MERERATKFIHELLDLLVKQKGSDLFITAAFPPAIKVDGKITPVSKSSSGTPSRQPVGHSSMQTRHPLQ